MIYVHMSDLWMPDRGCYLCIFNIIKLLANDYFKFDFTNEMGDSLELIGKLKRHYIFEQKGKVLMKLIIPCRYERNVHI